MTTGLGSREELMAKILSKFNGRVDELVGSFNKSVLSEDDVETVKAKYNIAFHNYLATALDIAFRHNQLETVTEVGGHHDDVDDDDLSHNLSVTDDDLTRLDNAISRNCYLRGTYPAKCSFLLERTLKINAEAAARIRTSVSCVDKIVAGQSPDDGSCVKRLVETVAKLVERGDALRSEIRDDVAKARRLEAAAKALADNDNN